MLEKIKETLLERTVKADRKELGQEINPKEVIHLSNERWDKITHNCTILGGVKAVVHLRYTKLSAI